MKINEKDSKYFNMELAKKQLVFIKLVTGENLISMISYPNLIGNSNLENRNKNKIEENDNFLVLMYPCEFIYGVKPDNNGSMIPSYYIKPWIDPTFCDDQIFFIDISQILILTTASSASINEYSSVIELINQFLERRRIITNNKNISNSNVETATNITEVNMDNNIVKDYNKRNKLH